MQATSFAALAVRDVTETIAFYERLGFTGPPAEVTDGTDGVHIIMNGDAPLFILSSEAEFQRDTPALAAQPLGASCVFCVGVADYDATAARIRDQAEVLQEFTAEGVFRMLTSRDLNGYAVAISEIRV
ncbi:VOC family protein [Streptomyces sp. NPDC099050]|uniref:VOC family protein n=1 Tax=Streptomyces sp. NPDC099050 TaxID=3366100 RepID=UPI00382C2B28